MRSTRRSPRTGDREPNPADIMEARQIFEPHAAALAAARAGSKDLSQLREALRRSLEAKSIETFERWDAEIHYLIFKATKNAVLLHYCDQINEVRRQPTWVKLKKRSLTPERRALYDKQHTALVEAIPQVSAVDNQTRQQGSRAEIQQEPHHAPPQGQRILHSRL